MLEIFYAECSRRPLGTPEKTRVDRMIKLLVAISERHYQLIIVVDGLDECSEADYVASRLSELTGRSKNIKVFVSSRDQEAIKTALSECIRVHIEPEFINDDAKQFQWAKCQIEHISKLPSRKAIENALDELPPDLDATYDRILRDIYDMGEENRKLANKTFHLLAVISVQVREELLLEALSVEEGDAELDTSQMCAPGTLLNICRGLIRLEGCDSGKRSFEVSHHSVLEYLQSAKCRDAESVANTFFIDLQKAYALTSRLCLTVLSFDSFNDSLTDSRELCEPSEEPPLFEWATLSWANYALQASPDDRPMDRLTNFLGSDSQGLFSCWAQKYAPLKRRRHPKEADIPKCLVYASIFGLSKLVSGLLEEGHDINAIDAEFGSPLIAAIGGGHAELVKYLIEHSTDLNSPFGSAGTPLQAAVLSRNHEIVEILLASGANVNATGGVHGTPLQAAIYIGEEWAVDRLTKEGADLETEGCEGPWKAGGGEEGEGSLRADSGEMETPAGTGRENLGHPLLVASMRGRERVVTKLIKAGADVNRVSGGYGTALCAAAAEGHIHIIRRLLKARTNVNLQAGCYGTALRAAAYRSNQTVVKMLLDSGADVNARGPYFGTALDAAKETANHAMEALLLDRGADPAITGTLEPLARLFQESELNLLFSRAWEGRYFYRTSLIPTHPGSIYHGPTVALNSGIINFNFGIAPISGADQCLGISSHGVDAIGTWDIEGVALDDGRIGFLKSYNDYECLRWQYAGRIFLEPQVCIGGVWGNGHESAAFLLRPRADVGRGGGGISIGGATWREKAPRRTF
ncbi:ankyrin repeat-containing domain protein [Tuber indicum]|nr:ankyrin repeat-containing domain protein [Tuber indicum]